ncbi:hypothetical protein HHK36_024809 [Tetracentron sinense]|uniref:Uncharacterized protein n=1 Tax=Tetracentron sinense TaxID=13715 RepID=A0A834YJM0_TETSI|nr:hypothetical protein HHK36_024809 [Tetracentron sinense]
MDQAFAAVVSNIWVGGTNFAPLLGGFISDMYLGKFRTIAVASFASLMGMLALTLTASVPELHPPSCTRDLHLQDQCIGPTKGQLGFLYISLGLLAIGAGGIRPCSLPFGVDQFDHTTEEGKKDISSFFNWYYFTFTIVMLMAFTVIVYIQTVVGWAWGLAIPTMLTFSSIVIFFLGTRVYVYIDPEGSIFSGIAQVFVAAYRKRGLKLPATKEQHEVLFDPPLKDDVSLKLPITQQFRFLNKAAVILEGEVNANGSCLNKWSLCSVQQVEEIKCLINIVPIWASGIICFTSVHQQGTVTVTQAMQMDLHFGANFELPPGSIQMVSMVTLGIWVPLYDRVLVPILRKFTKHEGGITVLQRMGIGILFSTLAMFVAGLVEEKRRASAILHPRPDGISPTSVLWLIPQLVLTGLAESFNLIGQTEFYYKEFPEHMRSIGNSLFFCTMGGAGFVSSFIVTIVHNNTGKHGSPNWMASNLNAGKLDYFYFLIAALGILNLIFFIVFARAYRYKDSVKIKAEDNHMDIELNTKKEPSRGEVERASLKTTMEETKKSTTTDVPKINYRGVKAMPFIIGNETFEKLGTIGTSSNLMVYLTTVFNMKSVTAATLINVFNGTTNLAPLLGAFLSDTYFGRYKTLGFASISSFMGMLVLTLTAAVSKLHPPSCGTDVISMCTGPTAWQMFFLLFGFGLLIIGAGGIRPCNLAFGADQFNPETESGKRGINSFFNWYYFTFTFAMMVSVTLIVYVQSEVNWALGLAIPTFLMFLSCAVFFVGSRIYVKVKPEGNPFLSVVQVIVAATKKQRLKLPDDPSLSLFNHIPTNSINSKLPYSDQFRFLDKAAIVTPEDQINSDGSAADPWRLCGMQQVEEVKCLTRLVPIWASAIVYHVAMVQQQTYAIFQALQSDRYLGNFEVPAASYIVFSMISLTVWIPVYDRIVVPFLRRFTGKEGGITILQRMGVGIVLSILTMIVSAMVEERRRTIALTHPTLGIEPRKGAISSMSGLWLIPQLTLAGLSEAFNSIGQIELYYKQFPENMRSIAGSFVFCGVAGSSYLSGFLVTIVHRTTAGAATGNWLPEDLNKGRLDYFYYMIAGLGVLNFGYFLVCARWYRYKGRSDTTLEMAMETKKPDKSPV